MRKAKLRKALTLISLFAALLLALPAFFTPIIGNESVQEEQAVFLDQNMSIDARASIDDPSHFIGESFKIEVVVQYDPNVISVDEDSFNSIFFAPLETVHTWLSQRELEDNIKEYRHVTEVRGFEVTPGKAYRLGPIAVSYQNLATGTSDLFSFDPNIQVYFGKYYGDSAEGVSLPLPKQAVASNLGFKNTLLQVSLLLSLAALGLVVLAVYRTEEVEEDEIDPKILELLEALDGFENDQWLKEEDARSRMHELEERLSRLSSLAYGIGPGEFWAQDKTPEWQNMIKEFSSGYKKEPPAYEDVIRAYGYAKKIFEPFSRLRRTNNRTLKHRLQSMMSKRKGR